MKKLCVVDVMGALYRQRIYQMLDSQYDCIWLFGKPEGGIKSMDLSLLKEVHEADILKSATIIQYTIKGRFMSR